MIVNGDSFIDVDLQALSRPLSGGKYNFALSLFRVADSACFGTVAWNGERVTSFVEKAGREVPGLINAGVYMSKPGALADWLHVEGMLSLEQQILPVLVARGDVAAIESGTRFIDIGLPETYAAAQDFFCKI